MKFITAFTCLLLMMHLCQAQPPLDSIQLKALKGPNTNYGTVIAKNPIILLCFWSSNVDPSVNGLNAISAQYGKWKQSASFKMLAICIDKGNLLNRMRSFANMNGWTFDVFGDINGDLEEFFHVTDNNLPVSIILNNGQVVYQQSGFDSGTENYLFTKIQALSAAKK